MKILVTGGAGFIGGHIVERLLQRGHEVAVIDNLSTGSRDHLPEKVSFFEFDIRNRSEVRNVFDSFQPEAICHQAAQMSVSRSVREPSFDAEVNIVGFVNVLEEAVRVDAKRIVFASSGGVLYGDVDTPVDENYAQNPQTPYGIGKWAGEKYLAFFTREHRLTGVALRYSNVYGPRQNPQGEAGVAAIFSTRLLNGESATINGDGKYIRDYVFVSDVVEANYQALTLEFDGDFLALNIGTGLPTDVNQLEEQIRKQCELVRQKEESDFRGPLPLHGPARAGDLRSNLISSKKAEQVLAWSSKTRLPEGIRKTVEWFDSRRNRED